LAALPTFSSSVEVLSEENEGRQRRWVVRGFTGEDQSLLESRSSVVSVRRRPASLDELFVACTRGKSPAIDVEDDSIVNQATPERQAS
jgi:ABC-2 type transport system ATP-binding protein